VYIYREIYIYTFSSRWFVHRLIRSKQGGEQGSKQGEVRVENKKGEDNTQTITLTRKQQDL
jgi:hypothetical protein